MQLPDEAIAYQYQGLLIPPAEDWTPAAELRQQHFLAAAGLKDLAPRVMQVRSQVAAERELRPPAADALPLDSGFIDLPQALLDGYRRQAENSALGRILHLAARLRDQTDRVVVLGVGGASLGARALFEALKSYYHNELPAKDRSGAPRIYFEGNSLDNDALHELFEMLQLTCVDPELRDERWGVVVISRSGETLETAAAFRAIRRELREYYGLHSPRNRSLVVAVTGADSKLRELCRGEGQRDEDVLSIPENVGGRFSVFSAAGLLPAAIMGLDVRALLLGAAAMTRRFLEEPFERNPVLQYAAVNHLVGGADKPLRVLAVWSKKLEGLGRWYDHLLAESLGKQGQGPTPLTMVATRDLHARGQQHQDGRRDRVINNLLVKTPSHPPIMIGMMDGNQDDLNQHNRKSLADLMSAAQRGTSQAYWEASRPCADLVMPTVSEHTMGQLMQLMMLATVVEGRLMGVNPYGQPGLEAYQRNLRQVLKS